MDIATLVRRICMCIALICVIFGVILVPTHVASAESANASYVRVIHASPFVGVADVFVDGSQLLSSFKFASITDYVAVPAGVHKVQIALVGKGIDASVLTQELPVQAGYSYTIAALGTDAGALSLQVFVDNNQSRPDQSKIRVYHLAPDAGSVNVSIGEDISLNGLSYQQASDYYFLAAGPCEIKVFDPQQGKTLSLSTQLSANSVTSLFAVGLFQGSPQVQLVTAQSAGIPALPNTGSDPTLGTIDSVIVDPIARWLLVVVALSLLTASIAFRHLRRGVQVVS